jgi:hypothetical protein
MLDAKLNDTFRKNFLLSKYNILCEHGIIVLRVNSNVHALKGPH